MKLELRDIGAPEPLKNMTYNKKVISVSEKTHDKVKEIAKKTGYSMKDMGEILVKYAVDNIEWR